MTRNSETLTATTHGAGEATPGHVPSQRVPAWTDETSPPDFETPSGRFETPWPDFETPSGLTFENDDTDRSAGVSVWCIAAVLVMCIAVAAFLIMKGAA